MSKIKPMELENGQWVYVQVDENIILSDVKPDTSDSGFTRKGLPEQALKAVNSLGDVIRAMSETAATALQNSALGNVEKVTLEFGVTLSGEVGFFVSGKAEGSVNVTVEFSPKKS